MIRTQKEAWNRMEEIVEKCSRIEHACRAGSDESQHDVSTLMNEYWYLLHKFFPYVNKTVRKVDISFK